MNTRTSINAFVAGATGLTGRHVVESLRLRGVRTIAHVRPDSSRLAEWKERFESLGADVSTAAWTESDMAEAFKAIQPNVVFALLGTTKKKARKGGGDYQTVDYGLTKCLIRAAEAQALRPHFVYLSAVGVTQDTRNPYMRARAQVEFDLNASDLTHLTARPSFILGNRDDYRPGESIGAPLLDGMMATIALLGGRRVVGKYRSMPGHILAQGLVELALQGAEGLVHVPEIKSAAERFRNSIAP